MGTTIHERALVETGAVLGEDCKIWFGAQVRSGATLGRGCVVGKSAFVDAGVQVGDFCKLQNNATLYKGVTLARGVFVGPHVCFTNDRLPRAITPDGRLKGEQDWELLETQVEEGASIGAGAVILCGVRIGAWSMVGAGAVVTRDVPPHALVTGNPAALSGVVSRSGEIVARSYAAGEYIARCGEKVLIP